MLLLTLISCQESAQKKRERLINEWSGREIAFPSNILCLSGEDTLEYKIPNTEYLFITYIDSVGCTTLRKQLSRWKNLITSIDSLARGNVSFVFFLKPSDVDEVRYTLLAEDFLHPVCFDVEDRINSLNQFPKDMFFQSFLLDRARQIVGIGNPILDDEVHATYKKIVMNRGADKIPQKTTTEVSFDSSIFDMGEFDYKTPHHINVSLKNTGDKMLVIEDVITSCSCIYVEYSREPVPPGKKWNLYIRYEADKPEFFNRDMLVYCNTVDSPLNFTVMGTAK